MTNQTNHWTFITNHGAVLAAIARRNKIRARDIAVELDLTERSVRRIIADLESAGYVSKRREGWVNRYYLRRGIPMRRPEMREIAVCELLKLFTNKEGKKKR